ncbi:hypothetical protein JXL19_00525 [bacterium]|nr:hypothetical protein [bacterium]
MVAYRRCGWILKGAFTAFFLIRLLLCIRPVFAVDVFPKDPVTLQKDNYQKSYTRVASNGDGYLCVWDSKTSANGWDIFGQLIDPNGTKTGDIINIASYGLDQKEPHIDSDGDNYLVVWSDARGSLDPNQDTGLDIYGAIILPDGSKAGVDFIIETAEGKQAFPKAAWNGSHYIVVWEDWNGHNTSNPKVALKAKRVDSNGQLIDQTAETVEADLAFNQKEEKECFDLVSTLDDPNNPSCFIIWSGKWQQPDIYDILGKVALEDPNGRLVIDPFPRAQIPLPYNQYYPSVEYMEGQFLVVWENWSDSQGTEKQILGINLDAGGNVLSSIISISPTVSAASKKNKYPDVAINGRGYFVLWSDQEGNNLYGIRVSQEGIPLEDPSWPNGTTISADPNQVPWYPSVASNREGDDRYFCLWSSVKGQSWSATGRIYDPPPPPMLNWVGSANYSGDGVHPDFDLGGRPFTFKVKYVSDINEPPLSIEQTGIEIAQVWIDLNDDKRFGTDEMFQMDKEDDSEDPNYSKGVVYTYHVDKILFDGQFDGDGEIDYRFFFMDKYNVAEGDPTEKSQFQVTMNGDPPELYWTDEPGFTGDGTRPDGAEWTETRDIEFRVSYVDADDDNTPVSLELWLDKNGDGVFDPNERFQMQADGTDAKQRKIYTITIEDMDTKGLMLRGQNPVMPVVYKFMFDDGKNMATGEPRLGSYFSFDSVGETPACLNMKQQLFPSIVDTGNGYQIFWEDHRETDIDPNWQPGFESHIWTVHLSYNGQVKDGSGETGQSKMDAGDKGAFKPIAHFDPDAQKTLLLWEDLRDGDIRKIDIEKGLLNNVFKPEFIYEGLDLYGIFIDAGGNIITDTSGSNVSGEFVIAGQGKTQNMLNPDIALGPDGQYIVVWEDESQIDGYPKTDIFAGFIRYPEGAYGDSINLKIKVEGWDESGDAHQIMPRAAWNGKAGYYMVVWQHIYSIDPNTEIRTDNINLATAYNSKIYGITVDPNGKVHRKPGGEGMDFVPPYIETDTNISQYFPDIASDPNNDHYLIVWQDDRSIKTRGYDIYGMRVTSNGTSIDPPNMEIPICIAEGHQINPRVFWDSQAGQYLITWIDVPYDLPPVGILYPHIYSTAIYCYGTIKAVRMNSDGELLDDPSTFSGTNIAGVQNTQARPDMCCDPDKGCRAVWEDIRNTNKLGISPYDLYTSLFQSTLNWTDDTDFINGVDPYQGTPGATFNFEVEYRDRMDALVDPNKAQIWIDLDDNGEFEEDEKFRMTIKDPNSSLSGGQIFTYSKQISFPSGSDGVIAYRFYFENDWGAVGGTGSGVNYLYLDVSEAPTLDWTNRTGFITDGVIPNEAESGSEFEFSVIYTDLSNFSPIQSGRHVLIDFDEDGEYDSWFLMSEADSSDDDLTDGKEYKVKTRLYHRGHDTINYKFYFHNGIREAEGKPASAHTFRIIESTSPVTDVMWKTFYKDDGLAGDFIVALAVDENNILWAGCSDMSDPNKGGVSRYDGQNWTSYSGKGYLPSNSIINLVVSPDNDLWVLTGAGVSRYDGSNWEQLTSIDPNGFIFRVVPDDKEGVWLESTFKSGSQSGDPNSYVGIDPNVYLIPSKFIKYESGKDPVFYNTAVLGGKRITAMAVDLDGIVWAGVVDYSLDPNKMIKEEYKGIVRFDPDKGSNGEIVGRFNSSEGGYPGGDAVVLMYRDDTGDIWSESYDVSGGAREYGGLAHYSYSQKSWIHHFVNGEEGVQFGANIFRTINRKGDDLWLGHWPEGSMGYGDDSANPGGVTYHNLSTGVWSLINSKNTHTTEEAFLALDYINSLVTDKGDIVWFGTINGLFRYNPEGIDEEKGEELRPYKGFFDPNSKETGCFVEHLGNHGPKISLAFLLCISLFLVGFQGIKWIIRRAFSRQR